MGDRNTLRDQAGVIRVFAPISRYNPAHLPPLTLTPGTRLGPYEVVALIGAGGMGEVYRARDTKLNRDVAIKVLPDLFAADPGRLARLQREAQVLAALNHPNIAHIYGLEEANGIRALVMELVEGPTLADRIGHGPIPVAETLPIAKQIADALEAAHELGVTHRDLKPANIKVREDGMVKVLDFGLGRPDRPRLPPTPVTSRRDARCRAGGTGDTAGDTEPVLSPAGRQIARILATCPREGMANGGGLEIHSTPSQVAKALSKPFPSAPLASPRPYNYLRGREQPVAETVPNTQPSFSPQAFDFHRASAAPVGSMMLLNQSCSVRPAQKDLRSRPPCLVKLYFAEGPHRV